MTKRKNDFQDGQLAEGLILDELLVIEQLA